MVVCQIDSKDHYFMRHYAELKVRLVLFDGSTEVDEIIALSDRS